MILTIGEILVEIMAGSVDQDFRRAGTLVGPFASGAPAVFIDQVARLGHACGIVGAVGDDEFGDLNIERLKADGVDTSAIRVAEGMPTGTAFVRYRRTGERDFVFNLKHSACSAIRLGEEGERLLKGCSHLHVMGSSLFSFRMIDIIKTAADRVKANGGTVSFCPNVSKELLRLKEMRSALQYMLELCDVFLPNTAELTFLTRAKTERGAVDEILQLGVPAVVVRQGEAGATYFGADRVATAPAFRVNPIDRTGAGDCFAGSFVTFWRQGADLQTCLRYANAAGARAMLFRGPMEGTSNLAQLDALMAPQNNATPAGVYEQGPVARDG